VRQELQDVLSFLTEKAKAKEVRIKYMQYGAFYPSFDLAQPIMEKMTMRSGFVRSERILARCGIGTEVFQ